MLFGLLSALSDISLDDVLIPLLSAALGASAGALVARHLRREELYAQAAEKVNGYVDEAVEGLNAIDREAEFNLAAVGRAKGPINLARFHSKRLESDEVTNRLAVTDFILHDVVQDESYKGLHWAFQSIDDVMQAVVEYMILPRRPWKSRSFPPNELPNNSATYRKLVKWDGAGHADWSRLQAWVTERRLKLELEKEHQRAAE